MRINIQKFQAGGDLLTYKAPPILAPSAPAAPPPQEEFDDSIFDKLIDKAVGSDAAAYVNMVKSNFQRYSALPSMFKESAQGRMLRASIYDKSKLADMSQTAIQLTELRKEKKDAMGDFAVNGKEVMVQDNSTGNIGVINVDQYAQMYRQDPTKYKALTNGELMNLRQKNQKFAFDGTLPAFVTTAVSLEGVTKQIRSALSTIGNFSKGNVTSTAEETSMQEGVDGLQSKGLKYITTSDGSLIQSNAENIKRAAFATWSTLGEEAKTLLKVQALHNSQVNPKDLESAALGYAFGLLNPKEVGISKTTEKVGAPTGGAGSKGGSKDPSASGSGTAIDYLTGLAMGNNPVETLPPFQIGESGKNTSYKTELKGSRYGGFQSDKKAVGIQSLEDNSMANLKLVGDYENVSLNGVPVPRKDVDAVVYGGGDLYTVGMVWKLSETGQIVPDFDRKRNTELASEIIKDHQITDRDQRIKEYEDKIGKGVVNFDNEGRPIDQIRPFIVMDGYVSNDIMPANRYTIEQNYEDTPYQQAFRIEKAGKSKGDPDPIHKHRSGLLWWRSPKVQKGTIWMPKLVQTALISARQADGSVPKGKAIDETLEANQVAQSHPVSIRVIAKEQDLSNTSLK